jgi:hypothetical protein
LRRYRQCGGDIVHGGWDSAISALLRLALVNFTIWSRFFAPYISDGFRSPHQLYEMRNFRIS